MRICITLVSLALALVTQSQTIIDYQHVSGIWSQEGSPYLIQSDLIIDPAQTLIIEAGVDVIFQDCYDFTIYGQIIANGEPDDSVRFTVADTTGFYNGTHHGWSGLISFESDNENVNTTGYLTYTIIEYSTLSGILFQNFDFSISHSTIRYNAYEGLWLDLGNITLDHVRIVDNGSDGIYYYTGQNDQMQLTDFHIAGNQGWGINLGHGTVSEIRNGSVTENFDGGIFLSYESQSEISNLTIDDNGNPNTIYGGGIKALNECSVNNCIIKNNVAKNGGGIFIQTFQNSVVSVRNSSIVSNTAIISGGGIFNDGTLLLGNSILKNNFAESGGGLYTKLNGDEFILPEMFFNVIISNNHSSNNGGGIYIQSIYDEFRSEVSNLSIIGNHADGAGGGIYCSQTYLFDTAVIGNSIIRNNDGGQVYDTSGKLRITYSNVENGYAGPGNSDQDPMFVNDGFYPFDLSEGSPCINAGDPDFVPVESEDFAGHLRIAGDTVDMGAFESGNVFGRSYQFNGKLILSGAYNGNEMTTDLDNNNLIPLNQPYNTAPWFYTGNESVTEIPGSDVTDWILIEYRSIDNGASQVIEREAGFILSDGTIVDVSGFRKPVLMKPGNERTYLVIHHRNHKSVSLSPLVNSAFVMTADLTMHPNQVYGGKNSLLHLPGNRWGLIPANGLNDGQIDNPDKNEAWFPQNGQSGYLQGDFNLDGQVNINDLNLVWKHAVGRGFPLPD